MPKFTITTLGCKVNQYESEAIAQALKQSGWKPQSQQNPTDFCIINTCAVTHKAAMQSRQAIRRAIRENPLAHVIVTGCYAQTEPETLQEINGIDGIIGHIDKHRIPEMITAASDNKIPVLIPSRQALLREHTFKPVPIVVTGNRTRPFLKIQDGCDAYCTYCIVPYARGPSRSLPPEAILKNIAELARAGYHEVVLSGVHLGCYGSDLSPAVDLSTLLKQILNKTTIERVRLSSIEPHELSDDIIAQAAASDRFCRHFHIPLQSGDDHILKQMQRPYTRSFFKDLILKIKAAIPDAAIGVDVLAGFPGETPAAFENTYALIKELPITYLHVFPFSARKGTPAADYPDKVPTEIIKSRCTQMRHLGGLKKSEFYHRFIGKTLPILIEGSNVTPNLLKGITSNYLPVVIKEGDDLKNTLARVLIEKVKTNHLVGRIC